MDFTPKPNKHVTNKATPVKMEHKSKGIKKQSATKPITTIFLPKAIKTPTQETKEAERGIIAVMRKTMAEVEPSTKAQKEVNTTTTAKEIKPMFPNANK